MSRENLAEVLQKKNPEMKMLIMHSLYEKKHIFRHIMVKFQNIKDKRTSQKLSEEKQNQSTTTKNQITIRLINSND